MPFVVSPLLLLLLPLLSSTRTAMAVPAPCAATAERPSHRMPAFTSPNIITGHLAVAAVVNAPPPPDMDPPMNAIEVRQEKRRGDPHPICIEFASPHSKKAPSCHLNTSSSAEPMYPPLPSPRPSSRNKSPCTDTLPPPKSLWGLSRMGSPDGLAWKGRGMSRLW